jgi:WD40 repeat protein
LALLPDGKHVATIVFGDEVVIWNIDSGAITRRFPGTVPSFRALAVSPDGRLLVVGSALGILTVWNLESGEIIHQIPGHTLHMYEVAVTSDSRRAVTVSNDTTAVVWDLEKGEQVLRFQQHATSVQALALHPLRDWVLTGDDKGILLAVGVAQRQSAAAFCGAHRRSVGYCFYRKRRLCTDHGR